MDYKLVYKKIEKRFILMGIVLMLIFISRQIIVQDQINMGKDMSKAINISGRQRMLSQKITKDVLMVYENQNSDINKYYLNDLESSLQTFEDSHYIIIKGSEDDGVLVKNSDAIISMFDGINPYFNNILESGNKIVSILKQNDYDNGLIFEEIEIIIENEKVFLEKMDQIVHQYDEEAENTRLQIRRIELLIFYFMIFAIGFITIFIFIPTTKILRYAFVDINESNENIIKLFHTMKGPLFLVSEDGNIIIKNSDAEKLMDLNEVEIRDINIVNVIKWLDINIMDVIKGAISGNRFDNIQVEVVDKNENILILMLSAISGKYNRKDVVLISGYDITIQKRAEEVLKDIAVKDELTGLYNRHFLESIIEQEIDRSKRYDYPISAAILDIDDFKKVNDKWGHPMGDVVLKDIANILIENSRQSDYQIRIGGEEFIVLMPHTNLDGAYLVAEKFRKAIENNIHPIMGQYTASFGVAERKKEENYFELYNRIDNALYKAKKSGKNCVVKSIEGDNKDYKNPLEWKVSLESGEKIIDSQHKYIFNLLQKMYKEKDEIEDKEKLIRNLNVLINSIEKHFIYEEKVLKEIGYVDALEHKRTHDRLLEKTYNLNEKMINGEIQYEEMLEFISHDLILGQLLKEDTKFFKDIKRFRDTI